MSDKAVNVSWYQITVDSVNLASQIKATGIEFSRIVAIARGGVMPALLLSKHLNIREYHTIQVMGFENRTDLDSREIISMFSRDLFNNKSTLIVDELSDTGKTIALLRQSLPDAIYATLYTKPEGRSVVDLSVAEYPQDTWLVMPWE